MDGTRYGGTVFPTATMSLVSGIEAGETDHRVRFPDDKDPEARDGIGQ